MSVKTKHHPRHVCRWYVNWGMRLLGTTRLAGFIKLCVTTSVAVAVLFIPAVKLADAIGPTSSFYPGWLARNREGVAFTLLFVQFVSQAIASLLRRFDRVQVERVLNGIVDLHFGDSDVASHAYRATLFKKRSCPLLGSWLGIVARSGDNYRRMRTIFSIDKNRKECNSGVAGECWWRKKTIILGVEPIDEQEAADSQDARSYKASTFLADAEYACMTVKSCVFIATVVKVGGDPWGVLVLDSTDPGAKPRPAPSSGRKDMQRGALEQAAEFLGILLSGKEGHRS